MRCGICHGDKDSEAKGKIRLYPGDVPYAHEVCMNERPQTISCDWCGRPIPADNIWVGPNEATICEACYATGEGREDV